MGAILWNLVGIILFLGVIYNAIMYVVEVRREQKEVLELVEEHHSYVPKIYKAG